MQLQRYSFVLGTEPCAMSSMRKGYLQCIRTSAQADLGLRCPLVESMDTVKYTHEHKMI